MFRTLVFSTVAAAALAASNPASAQQALQIGVLECAGSPSVGFVIASSTGLNCVFRPSTRRGGEGYVGSMNRVGLDVGVTTGSGLAWLVFAPSANIPRGALAGSYGGASANASLLVGGGANVLTGGSNNVIMLQPVSVQGQTGVNVAATVTGFELRPAPMASAVHVVKKKRYTKKVS